MTVPRKTRSQQRTHLDLLARVGSPWVVLPLLAGALLALYLPGFSSWAVTDDLQHLKGALLGVYPFKNFFRPLESAVNIANVRLFGPENLVFARAVGLLGLFTVVVCTWVLGRRAGGSAASAALAAALVVVSSLATASTVQIDTLSQQFVTVFALLFLLTLLAAEARGLWPLRGLAYGFALLALLSKESAPGLVAAVPLAALLLGPPKRTGRQVVRGLAGDYLAVSLVVALYAALRALSGVGFGQAESGQYNLELSPARLLRNMLLYGGSLLYTGGSTLDLFPVLKPVRVAAGCFLTAGLLVPSLVGAAGLVRAGKGGPLAGFALLALAGGFPVALTARVSELYTYGSLPPYALLLGLSFPAGVGMLARRLRAPWLRPAAAAFAAVCLLWSAWGAAQKAGLVDELGGRSLGYVREARAFLDAVPGTPRLCWRDAPQPDGAFYGTFIMKPELVAGKALDFAAWERGRTLYLAAPGDPLKAIGAVRGARLPSPVSPTAPVPLYASGGCTYTLVLEGDALRFVRP